MDGNPRRNPPPWDLMLIGDVWEEDHSRNSIHSVNATSLQL